MSLTKYLSESQTTSGVPVYQDTEYTVTFDHFTNTGGEILQVILLHNDRHAGMLNSRVVDYKGAKYANVVGIKIQPIHRSKGFGKMMYETLIHYSPDHIVGLISNLKRRLNKNEVPAIYKRLGSVEEDGYAIIPFN